MHGLLDCTSMALKSPGGILKVTNINWRLLIWSAVARLMGFPSRYWYRQDRSDSQDSESSIFNRFPAKETNKCRLKPQTWQNFTVLTRDRQKITIQFRCSVKVKNNLWRKTSEKEYIFNEISPGINFILYNTFQNRYFEYLLVKFI